MEKTWTYTYQPDMYQPDKIIYIHLDDDIANPLKGLDLDLWNVVARVATLRQGEDIKSYFDENPSEVTYHFYATDDEVQYIIDVHRLVSRLIRYPRWQ